MNPGGIRADLVENARGRRHLRRGVRGPAVQQPGGVDGPDRRARSRRSSTQQWNGGNEGTNRKILQVSGLSYTWDVSDAALTGADAIVGDVHGRRRRRPGHADGAAGRTATTYRVAMNNFIADGGDNFTVLRDQGDEPASPAVSTSTRCASTCSPTTRWRRRRPTGSPAALTSTRTERDRRERRPARFCVRWAWSVRSADVEQVDHEDQGLAGLDDAAGAAVAVRRGGAG